MGVVAPNGMTLDGFWDTIRNGRSAAAPVSRFDIREAPTKIAAEVKDFEGRQYMDIKTARKLDRSLQFAIASARLAVEDARLDVTQMDPDRLGVVEGTSLSNQENSAWIFDAYAKRGLAGVSPLGLINGYCGAGSGEVALAIGCKGHALTCCSGSASGNDAVGYALNMIRYDEADAMLAIGAEAPLLPQIWAAFCQGKVMTRHNESPPHAMRPFDRTRDGFVLGEGAACLILEELSHALCRGAKIYAEIVGHGRSCEAYHHVAPHPEGLGIVRAMEKALHQARLSPSEVDYINAHGTATETNDLVETRAVKRVFGSRARHLNISSTKPVTGHLLAAAGAVESIICVLSVYHGEIPPTMNLNEPADECDLDYVPGQSRLYPVRTAMNLSAGFGGKNSCLLVSQYGRPS
jgi:3-oxoacyl-[acyl-carrier-protein] synthase II